jgi:hypothetical protein
MSAKIQKFIDLQDRANRMIDTYGQCDDETCVELERIGDSLTSDEVDEVCRIYNSRRAAL